MANNVFLRDDDRGLVKMRGHPYPVESLLQELLEEHPALLAGDPLDNGEERRLMLVRREAAVPDAEEGAGRYALDHLFVDQHGVPTLVEVKRSTDTRVRREWVGQMLDYAANAVAYWSVEGLLHDFEATCEQAGRNAEEVLTDLLNEAGGSRGVLAGHEDEPRGRPGPLGLRGRRYPCGGAAGDRVPQRPDESC